MKFRSALPTVRKSKKQLKRKPENGGISFG